MIDLKQLDTHLACMPWHELLGLDGAYLKDQRSQGPSIGEASTAPASNDQTAKHQQEGQHSDIHLTSNVQPTSAPQVGTVTILHLMRLTKFYILEITLLLQRAFGICCRLQKGPKILT